MILIPPSKPPLTTSQQLKTKLPESYLKLHSGEERRRSLISAMRDNEKKGKDCLSCNGACCTFAYNTMHVTPVEALDIVLDLAQKELIGPDLIEHLQNNRTSYQLDRPPLSIGRGSKTYRRGYTCPFFEYREWGCGLSVALKPYGCIAFNPNEGKQTEGGNCQSMSHEIKLRNQTWQEKEESAQREIAERFQLHWERLDLPSALLELLEKLELEP